MLRKRKWWNPQGTFLSLDCPMQRGCLARNMLGIRNPELALKSDGCFSIRRFLSGIKVNSIIILHFLINGLYPQRSHCSNVVAPNRNFQYRSEELVRAVNSVNAIVKQTLNGAKLKHKLLIAPFLTRYWYRHCNRQTCRSPVYKVHYLEGLEKLLRLSTGDFKLLSIKSLYNFLCKNTEFRVKILVNWKKRLDSSSLKSNACKQLILSELLGGDQVHFKTEYWTLYERYLMKEVLKL